MVNKVPKTIKVWYLFFYVNIAKMGACREEDEEEEVVYVGISVRGREIDRCSGGNVCNCVISAGSVVMKNS